MRDASEVAAALSGGADIIDVKDPAAGSLGRPQPHILHDIGCELARSAPNCPWSIALGELVEFKTESAVELPPPARWVKLGLARCSEDRDWQSRWQACRERIDQANGRAVGFVAVAYADCEAADSPRPRDVLRAAISTGCVGVLIDTFTKSSGRLRDWISTQELADWLMMAREHGLTTAVAGSLRIDDLEWLGPLRPDIVAIRSAACRDGRRTAAVDVEAVSRFRQALRRHSAVAIAPCCNHG